NVRIREQKGVLNALSRRFGVELEAGGNQATMLNALQEAGVARSNEYLGRVGNDSRYFTMHGDGSVPNGFEMKSPILDFDVPADRAKLTKAIRALKDAGARPVREGSIHVHVEQAGLTGVEMGDIARFGVRFEDGLYKL